MDFLSFFGRLHPLAVHFPVAILAAAGVLTLLCRYEKCAALRSALPMIWAAGAATAVLACATGWLLKNENLGEPTLVAHRNFGLAAAGTAVAAVFILRRILITSRAAAVVAMAALVSILPTLHLGTSITHGSAYFFSTKTAFVEASAEAKGLAPADDLPLENLPLPARPEDLAAARAAGLTVLAVAAGSPFLSVSAVNAARFSDSSAVALERLAEQIVWLKLSGAAMVTDSTCLILSKLSHLSRLHLDDTQVGDAGIFYLKNLNNLRFVNLVGTAVTGGGVAAALAGLPRLERLFLFRTRAASEFDFLKKSFPKTSLDTGGYVVPTTADDTTILKK